MSERTRVVVIGGGYAGVMAANRLTQRDDVAVTLVNPRPDFVQRIRLHQLVGGSHDAVTDLDGLLAERVEPVVGTAERIDTAGRTVGLAGGGTIGYDRLVYAVGSAGAAPDVPGAAEHAFPVATLEEARELRSALDDTPLSAPVVVVGSGPTGMEVAAELAEEGRPVTLVCGGVLGPYLHPRVRPAASARLTGLGVSVVEGPRTKVTAVAAEGVRLADGRELSGAVTVWTAGFGLPDLAARSGLSTDPEGRLLTDETLTSVDDARIVAAGDCAAPSGMPLRMSCQSAIPLGAHAADTVLAHMAGREPAPIEIGFFGQCIGLGGRAAVLQLASRDDVANRYHIGGRLAAGIKASALKNLTKYLVDEARKPGSYSWMFRDGRRRERVAAAERGASPVRG
ncbi:Nitric oxide reductase FlRd-NAD(+) reductase [Nocardiopsis dassonvillei]|uniref:NAD(P)/FAD-dependent oxidoreductase n=1 Tax=Nocardiopsis dassonvillei TaxID=2014 RepID=UPI003F57D109